MKDRERKQATAKEVRIQKHIKIKNIETLNEDLTPRLGDPETDLLLCRSKGYAKIQQNQTQIIDKLLEMLGFCKVDGIYVEKNKNS